MIPFLSNELARERIRDLRSQAAQPRRYGDDPRATLTLRSVEDHDLLALVRLAGLDGKPVPSRGVLVAEQGGQLVAALPLDGGPVLADPFRHTAGVVEMLKLRASQLEPRKQNRLRAWLEPKS
jgi:hypothetical protein